MMIPMQHTTAPTPRRLAGAFLALTLLATVTSLTLAPLAHAECSAKADIEEANTANVVVYAEDFENLPRLNSPLRNDGSEGFTTDLFHMDPNGVGNHPDGSEYAIAGDDDLDWDIATNITRPRQLPDGFVEPSGDFLVVNAFTRRGERNAATLGAKRDDNNRNGVTGEIFRADRIALTQDGTYDFSLFLTDVTDTGGNNRVNQLEFRDAVSGKIIASGTIARVPVNDYWHLMTTAVEISAASFDPANTSRQVSVALRQKNNRDWGADIGIDNVMLTVRTTDFDSGNSCTDGDPSYELPDAGLGEGPSCEATVNEDRLPRGSVNPADYQTATTLLKTSFDGDADYLVLSGSWSQTDGDLRQIRDCGFDYTSLLKTPQVENFRFETSVRALAGVNQGGMVINQANENSRSGAMLIDLANGGKVLRWGRYNDAGYYEFLGSTDVASRGSDRIAVTQRNGVITIEFNGQSITTIKAEKTGGHVGLVATLSAVAFEEAILTALPA